MFALESIPISVQKYLGEPDERVKNWTFLNSPLNLLAIYAVYAICLLGGRRIMRDKQALQLKAVLVIYNIFQIVYTGYICKEVLISAYLDNYKFICSPLNTTNSEIALRMANAFWYFYVSKIIDLLDTVFFVLRKKHTQLSFLHLYHHTTMICNWYIGVLYVPGGQAFMSVSINLFVHVIMYTYYLLSALGPSMQKYLWWKKYLTQIQLMQFMIVMTHIIIGWFNGCRKPQWLIIFTISYLWTLVFLFANFYYHAYKKKLQADKVKKRYSVSSKVIDLKAGGDMKMD